MRYVTGEALTPVKPVWLDVRNCAGLDPVFDVPGGATLLDVHADGRLHPAGGRRDRRGRRPPARRRDPARAAQRDVRDEPFTSLPTWGGPKPQPLLHEPGPTKMSAFTSRDGDPGRAGQTAPDRRGVRQRRPHTRAMGIMLLFLAPGAVAGCSAAPALDVDLGARPRRRRSRCRCRVRRGARSRARRPTWVGDFRYGHERVVLRRGTTFAWRFMGSDQHDVTVVGGPVGFSSPWTRAALQPPLHPAGTYRLFCSLHPSKMCSRSRSARPRDAPALTSPAGLKQRCHALFRTTLLRRIVGLAIVAMAGWRGRLIYSLRSDDDADRRRWDRGAATTKRRRS